MPPDDDLRDSAPRGVDCSTIYLSNPNCLPVREEACATGQDVVVE